MVATERKLHVTNVCCVDKNTKNAIRKISEEHSDSHAQLMSCLHRDRLYIRVVWIQPLACKFVFKYPNTLRSYLKNADEEPSNASWSKQLELLERIRLRANQKFISQLIKAVNKSELAFPVEIERNVYVTHRSLTITWWNNFVAHPTYPLLKGILHKRVENTLFRAKTNRSRKVRSK